jgi:uncharacterized protein DUF4255
MSNRLAIAAVTATLRSLLAAGVGISEVTARPLDTARGDGSNGDQLNLFLYQALPDAAWRNRDMPRQTKPNETGLPPLPLTLYYLLTAYSDDSNDTSAHKLLGNAMGVLHDHPLLSAAEIKNATSAGSGLEDSDLHEQLERVRITLQPLTFEEISKLWTTFQTHYRTSAAYQVSLVLIESKRPSKTPLPVLKRGEDDRGVTTQPDMIPPFPALTTLELPPRRLSAQPGDIISVFGSRLAGGTARLRSLHLASPLPIATLAVSDAQLDVTLDNTLGAGFYTIAVELPSPHGTITSNELALAVAPVIDPPLPLARPREPNGTAVIDLSCSVAVLAEQRVTLLVGDFEVRREPPPVAPTNVFKFIINKSPDGGLPVPIGVPLLARLRVDGVDSEILAPLQPGEPESTPPEFDAGKTITIT